MKKSFLIICSLLFLALIIEFFNGCSKEDNSIAPYAGSPNMSKITVEEGVFKPKMTWVGGKISILAVNNGKKAALDSSLIWLVYNSGDAIDYPVKFGTLPAGAKDMTADYGGHKADSLTEDRTFTFWVLKDVVWNQISNYKGKFLHVDSALSSGNFKLIKDTLYVSPANLTVKTQNLDVFINIDDITQYGGFATVNVLQPTTSPEVTVTWKVNPGVSTDTLVSAVGAVEGISFDENYQMWAAWSEETVNGSKVYGKKNVISSPVKVGAKIPGTYEFYKFSAEGFKRGNYYLVWIGNNKWDQRGRTRFTQNYAFATFRVR